MFPKSRILRPALHFTTAVLCIAFGFFQLNRAVLCACPSIVLSTIAAFVTAIGLTIYAITIIVDSKKLARLEKELDGE